MYGTAFWEMSFQNTQDLKAGSEMFIYDIPSDLAQQSRLLSFLAKCFRGQVKCHSSTRMETRLWV